MGEENVRADRYTPCAVCSHACFIAHGKRKTKPKASLFPCFLKTLPDRALHSTKNCFLKLPISFVRSHSSKIKEIATLEGASGCEWRVKIKNGSICGGWRIFARDHWLEKGEQLMFTLISDERFIVQVFDKSGCEKASSYEATITRIFSEGSKCGKRKARDDAHAPPIAGDKVLCEESQMGVSNPPNRGSVGQHLGADFGGGIGHNSGPRLSKVQRMLKYPQGQRVHEILKDKDKVSHNDEVSTDGESSEEDGDSESKSSSDGDVGTSSSNSDSETTLDSEDGISMKSEDTSGRDDVVEEGHSLHGMAIENAKAGKVANVRGAEGKVWKRTTLAAYMEHSNQKKRTSLRSQGIKTANMPETDGGAEGHVQILEGTQDKGEPSPRKKGKVPDNVGLEASCHVGGKHIGDYSQGKTLRGIRKSRETADMQKMIDSPKHNLLSVPEVIVKEEPGSRSNGEIANHPRMLQSTSTLLPQEHLVNVEKALNAARVCVLKCEKPSVVVVMRPSHISKNCLVRVPRQFSREHLPKTSAQVTLLSPEGQSWAGYWNPNSWSIGGQGWRDFAHVHSLKECDACVFEVIGSSLSVVTVTVHIFPAVKTADGVHRSQFRPSTSAMEAVSKRTRSTTGADVLEPVTVPSSSMHQGTQSMAPQHAGKGEKGRRQKNLKRERERKEKAIDPHKESEYKAKAIHLSTRHEAMPATILNKKEAKRQMRNILGKSSHGEKVLKAQTKRNCKYYPVVRLLDRRKGLKEAMFLVELEGKVTEVDKKGVVKQDDNGNWWVPYSHFSSDFLSCFIN